MYVSKSILKVLLLSLPLVTSANYLRASEINIFCYPTHADLYSWWDGTFKKSLKWKNRRARFNFSVSETVTSLGGRIPLCGDQIGPFAGYEHVTNDQELIFTCVNPNDRSSTAVRRSSLPREILEFKIDRFTGHYATFRMLKSGKDKVLIVVEEQFGLCREEQKKF